MRRRQFLEIGGTAFAAAIAAKAASAADGSPGEWRNKQSGMAYRRLGKTGFMVSEIVMGGNLISPRNHEHVLAALDMGLNYLDTAPAYGRGASEEGYAAVVKARPRDSFFINTKVSLWDGNRAKLFQDIFDSLSEPERKRIQGQVEEELARRDVLHRDYIGMYNESQPDQVRAAVLANVMSRKYGRKIDRAKHYRQLVIDSTEESLRRLGVDYLDVITCPHGASTPFEVLEYPEVFDAFEKLKKDGKVRHLSVSAHNDPGGVLDAAVDARAYSMAMVAYNIVNHRWVAKALEKAKRHDLGVIAMKSARPVYDARPGRQVDPARVQRIEEAVPGPLKTPQKAYLWCLRNPNLSAVISEMSAVSHVNENLPLAGRGT
ncbi:MAG: aldo/keto reductase [Bryobacteraceae bacterium]|nr:aldo/keto reductase [Bryobacteraceae bacterium]